MIFEAGGIKKKPQPDLLRLGIEECDCLLSPLQQRDPLQAHVSGKLMELVETHSHYAFFVKSMTRFVFFDNQAARLTFDTTSPDISTKGSDLRSSRVWISLGVSSCCTLFMFYST